MDNNNNSIIAQLTVNNKGQLLCQAKRSKLVLLGIQILENSRQNLMVQNLLVVTGLYSW